MTATEYREETAIEIRKFLNTTPLRAIRNALRAIPVAAAAASAPSHSGIGWAKSWRRRAFPILASRPLDVWAFARLAL